MAFEYEGLALVPERTTTFFPVLFALSNLAITAASKSLQEIADPEASGPCNLFLS